METRTPIVGVGVMILKEGRVLLGRRKGAHGAGEYAFPGGKLENLEDILVCARRETLEECGVEFKDAHVHYVSNVKEYAPKHYLHIGVIAEWASGEPTAMEPEKCEAWGWYPLDALPSPMFIPCANGIEAYRTGKNGLAELG